MGFSAPLNPYIFYLIFPVSLWLSSPFYGLRLGPISPFYLLLIPLILKARFMIPREQLVLFLLLIILPIYSYYIFNSYCYKSCDSFLGAIHPLVYSFLYYIRYLVAIYTLWIVVSKDILQVKQLVLLLNLVILIFFILSVVQLSLFNMGIVIGEVFEEGGIILGGKRFDVLFGEPNHVHSWLIPAYIVLNTIRRTPITKDPYFYAVLTVLIISFSTAWFLVISIYIIFKLSKTLSFSLTIPLIIAVLLFLFNYLVVDMADFKVIKELITINQRSVTILAGWEFFRNEVLFGYGVGMSPFFLPNSNIFAQYPVFNMSDLGRQNVMSTPLSIVFEFGVAGTILLLISLGRYLGVIYRSGLLPILLITFIPYLMVGSGFVAIPHLFNLLCLGVLARNLIRERIVANNICVKVGCKLYKKL